MRGEVGGEVAEGVEGGGHEEVVRLGVVEVAAVTVEQLLLEGLLIAAFEGGEVGVQEDVHAA